MTPLYWIVNGLLAILFFLLDHLAVLFLLAASIVFVRLSPIERRPWSLAASGLTMLAALFAPAPTPALLMLMALASGGMAAAERYNRLAMHWNIVRGMSLYSLAGLGYALWRGLGLDANAAADPMLAQGATYLNAIIAIAMYVIPLGYLVLLAQSIFAHPPTARPTDLLLQVRTRGKDGGGNG